jgi:SSS family solute:Na+ symporter/cation/acetate symporter
MTIYWRGFNRTGALAGMIGGLTVALVLVAIGPDVLGKEDAIFPLSIPAIVSVPAGVLCAVVGARLGRAREETGMPYDEFERRAFPDDSENSDAISSPKFSRDRRSPASSRS